MRAPMALGLVAVVAASIFVGSASVRPSKAQAWAWKDDCTAIIYNRTGSQGSTHPVTYVPVLPSPGSLAAFFAYAAIGIPVNQALPLVNVGYPVPAYGCHAVVATTSPVGAVSCAYSAPTTGANHFDCSDNVSFKIIDDSDDIAANVFIPRGSGQSSPPATGRQARNGGPAIRGKAIGKGWRSTNKLAHLGLIGRLMKQGTPTASCQGGGNRAPSVVRSTLLVHRGARGIGAVEGTYDDAHGAHQTVADVLSHHSIHCLDRLLTSRKLHTKVNSRPLAIARRGVDVRGTELVIRRRVHGQVRKAAYYDVIGASKGRRSAVVLLQSAHRPTGGGVQAAAVDHALHRIGA